MYTPIYKKELKVLWRHLKQSAAKRRIPFSLTLDELNNLSFPITCPILGLELKFHVGEAADNSYSIDRIRSDKGYEIDNIIVISQKANRIKNNATPEELARIEQFYRELAEDQVIET